VDAVLVTPWLRMSNASLKKDSHRVTTATEAVRLLSTRRSTGKCRLCPEHPRKVRWSQNVWCRCQRDPGHRPDQGRVVETSPRRGERGSCLGEGKQTSRCPSTSPDRQARDCSRHHRAGAKTLEGFRVPSGDTILHAPPNTTAPSSCGWGCGGSSQTLTSCLGSEPRAAASQSQGRALPRRSC
jgi:hypothetical protein